MTAAPPAKSARKPKSSVAPTKAVTRERTPTASRVRKELDILQHAEIQFAQFGFQGASLENIAVAAGISRHNLLYYFPSKEALYQRVLDDVLNAWLGEDAGAMFALHGVAQQFVKVVAVEDVVAQHQG